MATSRKRTTKQATEQTTEQDTNQQRASISESMNDFRSKSIAKQALNDADNDARIYFEIYQNRLIENMVSGFGQIEQKRVANYDLQANLGLQFCQELPQLNPQKASNLLPESHV